MALLKPTNGVKNVDYHEHRDNLYWGKYRYKIRIKLSGAQLLHGVKNISQWENRVNNDDHWYVKRLYPIDRLRVLVNKSIIENIIAIKGDRNYTVRVEGNTVAIFTNSIVEFSTVKSWKTQGSDMVVDVTEAKISNTPGIKYFKKNPKYNFRVYLRSKRVSHDVVDQLREFVENNPLLHYSGGLSRWISIKKRNIYSGRYCSSNYFIDYDDQSTITHLALCFGELLGKIYKLEKGQ